MRNNKRAFVGHEHSTNEVTSTKLKVKHNRSSLTMSLSINESVNFVYSSLCLHYIHFFTRNCFVRYVVLVRHLLTFICKSSSTTLTHSESCRLHSGNTLQFSAIFCVVTVLHDRQWFYFSVLSVSMLMVCVMVFWITWSTRLFLMLELTIINYALCFYTLTCGLK